MTTLAQTSVAVQIAGVVEALRKHGWSGSWTGPAGIGKSCAAAAIVAATPLTHMIAATEALGKKPNLLWQAISWELGVLSEDSAADTQQRLFGHGFKEHVLIVDEAQQLPPVQLREILALWDRCGLSVLFLGNMALLHRSHSRQTAWDQIATRLTIEATFEGFDDTDADAIAALHGVNDREALAMLRPIGERHYARGMVRVLEAARLAAGERGTIDAAALRKALQTVPKYRPARAKPERRAVLPTVTIKRSA